MSETSYWIGVAGAENFEILRRHDFAFFAVGRRFRRTLERVKPGDKLLLYRAGRSSGFCVVTSVVGDVYESQAHEFGVRALPYRIGIERERDISIKPLHLGEVAGRLGFLHGTKNPGVYLQTHLREIDLKDYQVIARAIEKRAAPAEPNS